MIHDSVEYEITRPGRIFGGISTMEINRETDGLAMQFLQQSMAAQMGEIPALLWRIDIARNEITFLNEHAIAGLEGRIHMLLQNIGYAREIVLKEDQGRFFKALENIRNHQPSMALFRIRTEDGMIRWLVSMGMPEPKVNFGYMGLVADCTDLVDMARNIECDGGLAAKLELFDTPVLLARFSDKRILAANLAAREYLGIPQDMGETDLLDLLGTNSENYLQNIYEQLIFSDYWNGLLPVTLSAGQEEICKTRIRAYARGGKNLLWISMQPPAEPEHSSSSPKSSQKAVPPEVLDALHGSKNGRELLEVLLKHQPEELLADAVMLSRIFPEKDRIMVTGVGAPFLSVEEDDTHPYEGSIAENIVRFNLDQIIVEETSKSIKPIDWALFIPRGIRSYYASPFFHNGTLRYVLIYCSKQPGRFTRDNVQPYSMLFDTCLQVLLRLFETPGA